MQSSTNTVRIPSNLKSPKGNKRFAEYKYFRAQKRAQKLAIRKVAA